MKTVDEILVAANDECRHELLLDFNGCVIRVLANSRALVRTLEAYYKHFLANEGSRVNHLVHALQSASPEIEGDWSIKQPDPGKTRIKEHILEDATGRVVRKILTGVHLIFAPGQRVCVGPLTDNPNQVVNFINNIHLDDLLARTGQLFHAAGVCHGSVGIGMAGQSGKGKSTLAVRLLDRGLDLVSNDRLVVSRQPSGLLMQGIAKYPRINPGTLVNEPKLLDLATEQDLARYRAMPATELWDLEEKYDAFVEPAFGAEFKLGADMKYFIGLDWDRTSTLATRMERREPASCQRLVESFMKRPGVMVPSAEKRIGEPRLIDYVDLLDSCEFYVLTGKVDFDRAADEILELIN